MRYISTRGEAPALGFIDVTLAGLARDGGLYVPESWPVFSAEQIAALAGRPYAEVACEVVRPFVGGAIRTPISRAWRTTPTARSAIRRSRRCAAFARHVRARAVSRSDARLQGPRDAVPARLMDHALAQRGERSTIVVATSGDTGGAAVEAFRGSNQVDRDRALSARPHLRRAAAHDDDAAERERARARDRRHVRRLPGDREGHVQSSRLPRPRAALGRQLDQLGAHRRAGRLLFHRRGRAWARRTARSPSRCRPEISATCSPAMWRSAWACRSSGSWSRPTSTTSWCARSRPAPTRCAA